VATVVMTSDRTAAARLTPLLRGTCNELTRGRVCSTVATVVTTSDRTAAAARLTPLLRRTCNELSALSRYRGAGVCLSDTLIVNGTKAAFFLAFHTRQTRPRNTL